MTTVLALSGGLDSLVLLAHARDVGEDVILVGFSYGSKHNQYEHDAALQIAAYYGLGYSLTHLQFIADTFKSDLLKSGGDIPEGHYEAESMKQTVVPCRNLIFISILAGIAESEKADKVALGVHAGDHTIYPDCRPGFVYNVGGAIEAATDNKVHIHTPFLHMSKAEIVAIGHRLRVPFHLSRTCYKDQPIACGKCGSCGERLEAFAKNNLKDPIPYEQGPA